MKGSSMDTLLDPICDMVVNVAEARDQGLTLEMADREYAFCSAGCLAKFAKSPQSYTTKVDAWVAARARGEETTGHAHADAQPVIDNGMREWYKSCRCCMHDAYPAVVEMLDAERDAKAQPQSGPGICETAESAQT